MIPASGRLEIRLIPEGAALRARIDAPAPLPFERLLKGRKAEEAARLVPLLFNVCAAAQGACARAAFGLKQAQGAAAGVRAETLRAHALKLCLELPTLLGQAPDPSGPAATADPDAGRAALFGGALPDGWDALRDWAEAGRTAPARALAALLDWPEEWGRSAPLRAFDAAEAPDWSAPGQGGRAVENSVLARMARAPLTSASLAARGPGPATRAAALLEEAAQLLHALDAPDPVTRAAPFAAAEAGRGTMVMQAELDAEGRVAGARRLSPTDFALAPGGALETALAALPPGPAADPVARAAIALVDPCIPWSLNAAAGEA